MKNRMLVLGAALAVFLLIAWSRPMVLRLPTDSSWPLLIGLLLAYWLGRPWTLRERAEPIGAGWLALAVMLYAIGLLAEYLLAVALGWTLLLLAWIRAFWRGPKQPGAWSTLALFSFPWIASDFGALGWYFRLSGAWVSEQFFAGLGFSIRREGTLLDIQGLPVAIEPACAGMNLLPALMLTGAAVGLVFLGGRSRFWIFLALLFPLAWLANTIRICVISGVALTWGSQFASGFFHTWGALLVLGVMFVGCVALARALQPAASERRFV
ncbi:archaeosortase/exosortase family protein [Cerasicoccus frondis]|uniref:archaeosortase/exosortase family protein n=1 Tax=Cerasicoccus frondis TaxID=490090 RepID=UPI0028524D60|nr:archaeosortase/exosortase family protein [Cerasicoccus frondis]